MEDVKVVEETVEVVEIVEPKSSLGKAIAAEIESLKTALMLAEVFEGGLTTKSEIMKTSVSLRETLYGVKNSSHSLYREVLEVKESLLENLGAVQAADKKAKLLAEIEEKKAALADLG